MTTTEIIQVLQAHERGEKIEVRDKTGSEWVEIRYPNWNFAGYRYRVATPPKTIPLTPADVPPGSVFRCSPEEEGYRSPIIVAPNGILIASKVSGADGHGACGIHTWMDICAGGWQILRPGGVWEPASKTV